MQSLTVQLPKALKPLKSTHLVRLGRDFDGGYLVDSRDVEKSDCLISLGISNDWSFENDFVKRKSVPVFAYDGSVSVRELTLRWVRSLFKVNSPRRMIKRYKLLREFKKFFRHPNVFSSKFVGEKGKHGDISLREIINDVKSLGFSKTFLKIDIEESEYEILQDILGAGSNVSGLVIEFHNVENRFEEIIEFTSKTPLNPIHIHVNNYTSPGSDERPLAVEMTFSSSSSYACEVILPNPLDMPNSNEREDYKISFY